LSEKTIEKILSGISDKNIRFSDLREILIKFGFTERTKGNHHIFTMKGIIENMMVTFSSFCETKL